MNMEQISSEVLTSIITFLKKQRWLYDFPMTQVFTNDSLAQFPSEWKKSLSVLPTEHLNGLPQCICQVNWPTSLNSFLQTCEKFSIRKFLVNKFKRVSNACQKRERILPFYLPKHHLRKMSPKKKHEVEKLTALIQQLLNITKGRHIVDIGSGLGYIDAALHYHLNVSILGAESDVAKVKEACERQMGPKGEAACPRVKHIHWTLEDTEKKIQETCEVIDKYYKTEESCHCSREKEHKDRETEDPLGNEGLLGRVDHARTEALSTEEEKCGGVTLLGLHACADLSPVMLKIFHSSQSISSLVLLSCCYHKMQPVSFANECVCDNWKIVENHEQSRNINHDEKNCVHSECDCEHSGFSNFPLSKGVKEICEKEGFIPSVYGLRLAAQESGQRWIHMTAEAHETHLKNVAFRAVLETYCTQNGLILKKKKRRCARSSQFSSFEEYVSIMAANHSFVVVPDKYKYGMDSKTKCMYPTIEITHEAIIDDLLCLYSKYEPMFNLLESLTGLQLALQPVWEALVTLDRVVYLQESGYKEVWLEQVFDETLSPRCVALVAVKE